MADVRMEGEEENGEDRSGRSEWIPLEERSHSLLLAQVVLPETVCTCVSSELAQWLTHCVKCSVADGASEPVSGPHNLILCFVWELLDFQ